VYFIYFIIPNLALYNPSLEAFGRPDGIPQNDVERAMYEDMKVRLYLLLTTY